MNVSQYIEAILAGIALIVWLVRLEGKNSYNERMIIEAQKDIDAIRATHNEVYNKIADQLSDVKQSLARLEGRLGIKKEGE